MLVIEGALRENGGLRISHDLANRWTRAGVPTRFLVLETVAPDGPMLVPDPALDTVFGSATVRRFRTAAPLVVLRLLREAWRADVVVSGSEVGYNVILGRPVTAVLRRPFVTLVQAHVPTSVAQWQPARLRGRLLACLGRADLAVCVGPGLVDPLVAATGLPRDRVRVVDIGIDVDAVVAAAGSARTRQGPPLVAALGRLVPDKGFDLLVRAHAKVLAEGPAHRLRIVGEGPQRAALERLVADLEVQDTVDLPGFEANPYPGLADADLFVLSSRSEGSGSLVLLEALALGLPVVAADCPTGPRRLLDDGRHGRLVPAEDVDALAAAITDHLRDPGPLRALASGGPDRARRFDQRAAAQEILGMVCGLRRSRRTGS